MHSYQSYSSQGFPSSLNLTSVNSKVGWNWQFVTARIPLSKSVALGQGSGQTESESLYLQHGEWKCYIFSLHFHKSTCYTLICDCIFNCCRGNEVFCATHTTHIVLMCGQPGVIFMMYSLLCINHFLEVNNLVINFHKKCTREKNISQGFLPLNFKWVI